MDMLNPQVWMGVAAGALVLMLAQVGLAWRAARLARRAADHQERLERLADALSLLTETSESGFKAVAAELERIGVAGLGRRADGSTTRRVVRAARRGQSVPQIAAEEQVSEGEVHLRLKVAADEGLDGSPDDLPLARGLRATAYESLPV